METTNIPNPPTPETPPTTAPPPAVQTTPAATQTHTPPKPNSIIALVTGLPLPIKIAGAVTMILVLLALIFTLLPQSPQPAGLISSPSPVATQSGMFIPEQTSEFAKTDSFKGFEAHIADLKKDNESVDLQENNLSFPFLDTKLIF